MNRRMSRSLGASTSLPLKKPAKFNLARRLQKRLPFPEPARLELQSFVGRFRRNPECSTPLTEITGAD